jgi:1,4-dihydroxy-2-naphthoyl-CoA hydrolase
VIEPGRDGISELLGIEEIDPGDADAAVRLAVTDDVRQPFGLVHGGVYSLLAETVTSRATGEAVYAEGKVPMGQSNIATFLRPVTEGHVTARAWTIHRGRTTWVWDVECLDGEGRTAAVVRCVVAVRKPPGS